jgi:hypothetical protein
LEAILPAVAVKPAVVAPAATATEAGTVSSVLFEAKATVDPPDGAAALNVTVQVLEAPDARLAGLHCSNDTATAGTGVLLLARFCAWNPPITSSEEKYPPP